MKRLLFPVLLTALLLSVSLVFAADRPLRGKIAVSTVSDQSALKEFLADISGEILEVNDLGPLYEIVISANELKGVIYLTPDGKYLILGAVRNEKGEDIAQTRFEELNKIGISQLPVKDAVKIVRGNGSKELVMVTDVDCPFCRKAFDYLKSQTDYTLYVFLFPLEQLHPSSKSKSISILCAEDRVKALTETKEGKEITVSTCPEGEALLSKHIAVGNRLKVVGTPVFVTSEGERIEGADITSLEKYLKSRP